MPGRGAAESVSGAGPVFAMTGPVSAPASDREPGVERAGKAVSDADAGSGMPARPEGPARQLLPSGDMRLEGETMERRWAVWLTPSQAAGARLELGFRNAVFVAPETSSLAVSVNGAEVLSSRIDAVEDMRTVSAEIPPGRLQPGWNLFEMRMQARHRTDCGAEAAYALWTEIDAAASRLVFERPDAARLARLDEIRAIGSGPDGRSRVAIFAPSLEAVETGDQILDLAQSVALMARRDGLDFDVDRRLNEAFARADLKIVMAAAGDLGPLLEVMPEEVRFAPLARFIEDPEIGSVLLISGPDRPSLDRAIAEISELARAQAPAAALPTAAWSAPDVPILGSGQAVGLAALGLMTAESSAMRTTFDFRVAMPADFYAPAFGAALMHLDGAISEDVLPESSIKVYVNGVIAGAMPLRGQAGTVFRDMRIRLAMQSFRPGINDIRIEAVMPGSGALACRSGHVSSDRPRFTLLDSTRFEMPVFARAFRAPNLTALAGMAWPYAGAPQDIPVIMDVAGPEIYSAAATFLGRLAAGSGSLLPVRIQTSGTPIPDRDAIFIGPASEIPVEALTRVGFDAEDMAQWSGPRLPDRSAASADTAASPSVLAEPGVDTRTLGLLPGGASRSPAPPAASRTTGEWAKLRAAQEEGPHPASLWSRVGARLQNLADLASLGADRAPRDKNDMRPDAGTAMALAQGFGPGPHTVWTVLTAPDRTSLKRGVSDLVGDAVWTGLPTDAVFLDAEGAVVRAVDGPQVLVASRAWSPGNFRLILARRLSADSLFFAFCLIAVCLLLGAVTGRLLAGLGRRSG